MECDLCGKEGTVLAALIEGSRLNVCSECGKHGKILARPTFSQKKTSAPAKIETVETIVSDYAERIRKAREKSGMTQAEFALKINEKESVVKKLENGSLTPSIPLARKLEKLLRITLVEIEKEESAEKPSTKAGPLTIGDLIKIKK